jgi:hypothetical protein
MTHNDAIKFLGLDPKAREPDIKKAYRQMAAKLHPDAGGPAHLFLLLREAYEVALKGDYQPRPEEKPNYNYARDYSYTYTHNSKPTANFNLWQIIKPFLFMGIWVVLVCYFSDDLMSIYYNITDMVEALTQVNRTMSL